VRRLPTILSMLGLILICGTAATSFAAGQNQPVTPPPHSPQRRQGLFDYVLGKVNPNENDYGASIESGRDAVVANTLDDLYFWSNVVTLFLLTGTVAVVLLQWRSAEKKEVIAASLIAQLWNGRVSDRIELERRTWQFNQLVETHNAEVEKALSMKSQPSEREKEATGNLSRSVRKLTEKGASSTNKGGATGSGPVEMAPDGAAIESIAGIEQSHLLLQRRIEAMQSNEQNLKQRLNQTTLLLDQERRRNASLKGA